MAFQYLKSLHIIFVVTWFAGLFYIVRLFVYFSETVDKQEPQKSILQKQYKIMQKRLWYGITWPSAIITLILGACLIFQYGTVPDWLWVKLGFVAGLFLYHLSCHALYNQQQQDIVRYTSGQLRVYNELATIFLFAIVFIVVLKNSFSWIYGIIGVGALAIILMLGIRIYKGLRK